MSVDQTMNEETVATQENERIPVMQKILDNPFLLLFIGVVVPTVFYTIWGIMEIITIPIAK
jgi:hypothetical protein